MDLQIALDHRAQVERFRRKYRTGLVTLLFTDIVGSTKLKQALGDREAVAVMHHHHAMVREILRQFPDGQEISTAGDSFFLVFIKPSDAVRFALLLQARLRGLNQGSSHPVMDRIGIHIGEVVIEEREGAAKPRDLYGMQVDSCARVMSLGAGNQILLTRSAFDNARQALKGEEMAGLGALSWLNHGTYQLAGVEEPVEICEVGEANLAALQQPPDSEKARRAVVGDQETVLGWRPAAGQLVPNTKWVLEQKLGEGGFGEVWLGRHQTMKERRVFKFCFRADRVRSLKREMTLFRILKERVGDHPNIVRLLEVYFDEPPFYVVMDHVEGQDLKAWCEEQGGVEKVPLAARLEIVAQIADALQAAHDAGVIHRDVKPGNILVHRSSRGNEALPSSIANRQSKTENQSEPPHQPSSDYGQAGVGSYDLEVKLTDFGIGQIVSAEALAGVTNAGFTQTIVAESSSSQAGSQMYMAPELLAGKSASTRSDIYSLGVVLYQLLVGDLTRPLTTDWADHIADPLLRDDLKHCFAGNPADRFSGAGQLAENLRALPQRRAELEQQQAELAARERAAYRRGMIRTAGIAALVVAGVALLALYAFKQAGRADRNAQQSEQQRQRAEKTARRLRLETYAANMRVAFLSLQEQNLGRAMELLRKHLPQSGEEDLRGFEWRYLWQQCTGDELATFNHGGIVNSAVFSADGRFIATGSYSGTVKIWDVGTRTLLKTFDGFAQDLGRNYAAFSPEGKWFAACRGQHVVVWDTSTWNQITTLPGDAAPLMFSPEGSVLAGWGRAGLRLWNTQRWEPQAIPSDVPYAPECAMAFAPDSRIVAVASASSTIVEVWSVQSPTNVATLPSGFGAGSGGIPSLAISKNRILAAGRRGGAGSVKLWDLSTRREIVVTNLHPITVFGLAFSPDGNLLASASFDQTVKLWNVQTLSNMFTFRGHQDEVWTIAFAPDGKSLLSGSKDGTAKLWSASPKLQPEFIPAGSGWGEFSSDGRFLIVTTSTKTNVSLEYWDISTARLAKTRDLSSEPAFAVIKDRLAMAPLVAPSGQTVALALQDGSVHLLDLATMALTPTTLSLHLELKDLSDQLFFSRDGRVLCLRNETRTNLWVPSLQREIPTPRDCLVQKDTWTSSGRVALSPDGKMLAGASTNYVVKLWDAATGRELRALKGHGWVLNPPLFSPDGRLLATMSWENSPRLWNVVDGVEAVPALKGHKVGNFRSAFSPDSRTFAASTTQGTKLWNVDTGQEIVSFDAAYVPLFSPDGNTLALRLADGNIRLIRVPSLTEIDATEKASSDRK